MPDFKIVIGTKAGKCVQREVKDPESLTFLEKNLGDTVSGDLIGMGGYEFVITGGSDNCGFPMRNDLPGTRRQKILAVEGSGVGFRKRLKSHGCRMKRSVAGNTIHDKIVQINLKVLKGDEAALIPPPSEKKAEEKKTELSSLPAH